MTDTVSRRAILIGGAGVVVGAAAMFLDTGQGASATPHRTGSATGASAPIPDGFTDLAGVRAEYAKSAQSWPFAWPEGKVARREPSFENYGDEKAFWEIGCGSAEVYFEWSAATASAAYAAHVAGDSATADKHLGALLSAYDSGSVRPFIEDPEHGYSRMIVQPALGGKNYGPLTEFYSLV